MQRLAFGTLGLLPNDFWKLTPSEFVLMLEAHAQEQERYWDTLHHLLAWHAANIMNACGHLKNPVDVDKLLGNKKKGKRKHKTEEDKKQELERIKREFGFE